MHGLLLWMLVGMSSVLIFSFIYLIILILTFLCSGMLIWESKFDIGEPTSEFMYVERCRNTITEGRVFN